MPIQGRMVAQDLQMERWASCPSLQHERDARA